LSYLRDKRNSLHLPFRYRECWEPSMPYHDSVEFQSSLGKQILVPDIFCNSFFRQNLVNKGEWLWSPTKFFVVCFAHLTLYKTQQLFSFDQRTDQWHSFWLRNSCVVNLSERQKIVHGRGRSNLLRKSWYFCLVLLI